MPQVSYHTETLQADVPQELLVVGLVMQETQVPANLLVDFMLYLKQIKEEGKGSIVINVRDGVLVNMEGHLSKVYANERFSEKLDLAKLKRS